MRSSYFCKSNTVLQCFLKIRMYAVGPYPDWWWSQYSERTAMADKRSLLNLSVSCEQT